MMAVGVGSGIQSNELQNIAKNQDLVFTVSNFNDLVAAVTQISSEVCDIIVQLTERPTNLPTFRPTATSIPTDPPTLEPTVSCVVDKPLDIAFVVDGSGSVQ